MEQGQVQKKEKKKEKKMTKVCALCGSQLVSKEIEYIEKINGHFLIIEDVPVRECLDNGHQFFQAKVAKEIERLFELDRQQALMQ